jgi:hypothetical protein
MTDPQTAHDAAADAPLTARDAVMDAYRPCTISFHAAAVLAALGIPADATVDDVQAAMAAYFGLVLLLDGETIEARRTEIQGDYAFASASSPAAAVLALHHHLTGRADG